MIAIAHPRRRLNIWNATAGLIVVTSAAYPLSSALEPGRLAANR